jgi:parallel beta-helix repeat protein
MHPKASDKGTGSIKQPYKTISAAAAIAQPGDTVLVFGGTYRERVMPARGGEPGKPVVYLAAPGEKVILKGSEIWKNEWVPEGKNIYRSKIDLPLLKNYNPFYIPLARMPGRKSLGQIFCNGYNLKQVDSIAEVQQMPGTWLLSYDSTEIIMHFPEQKLHCPIEKCLVEYSVRGKVFAPFIRGLGYINVEGFTIEHCANQFPSGFYNKRGQGFPQSGALSARSGHHWVIRGNTIRHAKSLGIDCGYEGAFDNEGDQPAPDLKTIGYHLIEHNTITDCGAGGIAGAWQRETIIRYNRIDRTNNLGLTAPETGGIKVHFFYDGLIEGNIFCHNECSAIWLDNQWYNSRVTRNVIMGSRGHGIFVELGSGGCLVDNNIVAFTEVGEGIYLHDAAGVTLAHNLLYANSHYGIYMRTVSERPTGNEKGVRERSTTSNNIVVNNIFIDNYRGPLSMPLETEKWGNNNLSDYNLFVNGAQWQWEGLAFNQFGLGSHDGRIPKDTLANALKAAFAKNNYPVEKYPNFDLWKVSPLLTLEWWQMLTGYDKHSIAPVFDKAQVENGAVEKGAVNLSGLNLTLILRNGKTFTSLKCPPIKEIKEDFYGNKVTGDWVFPGPFSKYHEKVNEFVLIPAERY